MYFNISSIRFHLVRLSACISYDSFDKYYIISLNFFVSTLTLHCKDVVVFYIDFNLRIS